MTHDESLKELASERYLLGELHGEARERFEEHLFECVVCAADVTAGASFLGASRQRMETEAAAGKPAAGSSQGLLRIDRTPSRMRLVWPYALAASLLLVLGYQNAVQVPRLKHQLAEVETPAVLHEVILAGAGARGGLDMPQVNVPRNGTVLLSVDIPGDTRFAIYLCSLSSEKGKRLWQLEIEPGAVHDAIPIRVPSQALADGVNVLTVQGFPGGTAEQNTIPVNLATYRFHATVEP